MNIRKFGHVGILVKDLEQAISFYREKLGLTLTGNMEVRGYQVRIASMGLGDVSIDLVEPFGQSPLKEVMEQKGEGLHHICLEVDDIEEALKELDKAGVQLLSKEPFDVGDGTFTGHIAPESANNVIIELKEDRRKEK